MKQEAKPLSQQNKRLTIARPKEHSRSLLRQKPTPKGSIFDGREFVNLALWSFGPRTCSTS